MFGWVLTSCPTVVSRASIYKLKGPVRLFRRTMRLQRERTRFIPSHLTALPIRDAPTLTQDIPRVSNANSIGHTSPCTTTDQPLTPSLSPRHTSFRNPPHEPLAAHRPAPQQLERPRRPCQQRVPLHNSLPQRPHDALLEQRRDDLGLEVVPEELVLRQTLR